MRHWYKHNLNKTADKMDKSDANHFVNQGDEANYPKFYQHQATWSFGDYQRWVIDAYELRVQYTKTKKEIVITVLAWNKHNGIMVLEEFWRFKLDEEEKAKDIYKKMQDTCADVHQKFTDGEFEEAPNTIFHRYLLRACWKTDREHLAKTNIPHINYAREKATYVDDWRSSIYGNRYPTGATTGF